ncbi:MAG TPA: ROK family protein [Moorella mulderi]|nr:ROK family protein [Moorella mulderi]
MYFLGMDLGGTAIKMGIVDKKGQIQAHLQEGTKVEGGARGVLEQMAGLVEKLLGSAGVKKEDIQAAGLGVPGAVDPERGRVILAPNLSWRDYPLKEEVEAVLSLPVVIENDAHMAALGEMWQGAGREYSSFLLVTVGTGIGSGMILQGRIWRGSLEYGAELGHVKMMENGPLCRCGGRGCLETLASASAMVRRFKEKLSWGRASRLGDSPSLGLREIIEAGREGDKLCREVLEEGARHLARALANVALTLGPEAIILGGGPAEAGDLFLSPIREYFREYMGTWLLRSLPLIPAQLGNRAGIIGAAYLAQQEVG